MSGVGWGKIARRLPISIVSALEGQLGEAQAAYSALQGQNSSLQAQISSLQGQLSSCQATNSEYAQTIVNLARDFTECTGNLQRCEGQSCSDMGCYSACDSCCAPCAQEGACFTADARILMSDGSTKTIDNVKVNDVIISYNEYTGTFEKDIVIETIAHQLDKQLIKIELSDKTYSINTAGHPILTTQGWKSRDTDEAIERHNVSTNTLAIGDEIITPNDKLQIINITEINSDETTPVYNLRIKKNQTYVANGMVVHNDADTKE